MRQEPEHFGDQELDLVYVAKRLKEALRLEQVFTDAGVDYLVEPDRYTGGVIFRSERIGAFFYVVPEIAPTARELMAREGFKPYQSQNETGKLL